MKTWHGIVTALALLLLAGGNARAQDAVERFYKGRQVTMLIGSAPGGGFDLYARLLARYMGKYIPGQPTLVPSNMPGAGGNVAASYLTNVAAKDGTIIAAISAAGMQDALIGDRAIIKYDPLKLNYLGSANSEAFVCVVNASSPIKTFEDVFTHELIVGGTVGSPHDMPTLSNNVLGTKLKIVNGYPGTREVTVAMDKGEVQGICGVAYSSISSMRPDWFRDGTARILVQEGLTRDPQLANVPATGEYVRTPEQKQIMEVVYAQGLYTRPFAVSPGVPGDRLEALRNAFARTLADPDLIGEGLKQSLPIKAMSGAEVQEAVRRVFSISPETIVKVKTSLEP